MKTKKQLLFLVVGVVAFVLILNFGLGYFLLNRSDNFKNQTSPTITKVQVKASDAFSYKGEDGIDALSILKKKVSVEQNESGLVVSIKGRKAMEKNREFWAFYVNGKLAEVGPAEYVAESSDILEWKIDNY